MIALPPQPDLDLASLVRTIPDFPKSGVQFRDITTLIGDAVGFAESVRRLSALAAVYRPDLIVAVEARGFLFGAAMATAMGLGLVPVRKAGKLPGVTIGSTMNSNMASTGSNCTRARFCRGIGSCSSTICSQPAARSSRRPR